MKHDNLREKCEKLLDEWEQIPFRYRHILSEKLEFLARDIRNEALEEAANELCGAAPGLCIEELCEAKRVRALKDSK